MQLSKSPQVYDRGPFDHKRDSDNSSSFRHHSDITNGRNIYLLGGIITVKTNGRGVLIDKYFSIRIPWVNLGCIIHIYTCIINVMIVVIEPYIIIFCLVSVNKGVPLMYNDQHSSLTFFVSGGLVFQFRDFFWLFARYIAHACIDTALG